MTNMLLLSLSHSLYMHMYYSVSLPPCNTATMVFLHYDDDDVLMTMNMTMAMVIHSRYRRYWDYWLVDTEEHGEISV